MPLYFAYGSNLDRAGMARRCPGASPLGPGRLAGHRFFIMRAGYASIRREPGAVVHGLLWLVPEAGWPALDAYEDVDGGLYRKAVRAVAAADGTTQEAVVYIGGSTATGAARPGYMQGVIGAAAALGLPEAYRVELGRWLPPR